MNKKNIQKSEFEQETINQVDQTTQKQLLSDFNFVSTKIDIDIMNQNTNIQNNTSNSNLNYYPQFTQNIFQIKTNTSDLLQINFDNKKKQFNQIQFLKNRQILIQYPETITQNTFTSYKLYTIKSIKNGKIQTIVNRRFSDFQYLQKILIDLYGGCIISMLPQKNFWTCFNLQGNQYIKYRLNRLKKFILNLLQHPVIRQSKELNMFLFVDSNQFSYHKGQFEQKIKLQDKFHLILQNAIGIGHGLLQKIFPSLNTQHNSIIHRSQNNVLVQYEEMFQSTCKALKCLKQDVNNKNSQKILMLEIQKLLKSKKYKIVHQKIQLFPLMQKFQDMNSYVYSCVQALNRRNNLVYQIQTLKKSQQSILKKNKNNPRSKEVDLLRMRIKKNNQKLQKWTKNLSYQLAIGSKNSKVMLDDFLQKYAKYRNQQYLFK